MTGSRYYKRFMKYSMAGILVTIVEYKNFCFLLAFTELAVGLFGKGAACVKLNAVGVGMCFAWRNTVLS
jgi:hypothetical protein